MFARALGQCVCIGLAALAIGSVHSFIRPVKMWGSDQPPTPPTTPAPVQKPVQPTPVEPKSAPGGAAVAPVQPQVVPQPAAPRDERMITLARFKELMSGPVPLQIIDAREPGEYAAGRIAGAINIPPSEFFGKIPDVVNQRLARDLPVVVYCTGGNCDASKLVALRLKEFGFSQTYVYEDGFNGWTKAGEAVEK